ncbi:MAG: hypothetical protein WBD10_16425, partial [Acidobacteriaceae bacterium]
AGEELEELSAVVSHWFDSATRRVAKTRAVKKRIAKVRVAKDRVAEKQLAKKCVQNAVVH